MSLSTYPKLGTLARCRHLQAVTYHIRTLDYKQYELSKSLCYIVAPPLFRIRYSHRTSFVQARNDSMLYQERQGNCASFWMDLTVPSVCENPQLQSADWLGEREWCLPLLVDSD